jgi:hypothetical protein
MGKGTEGFKRLNQIERGIFGRRKRLSDVYYFWIGILILVLAFHSYLIYVMRKASLPIAVHVHHRIARTLPAEKPTPSEEAVERPKKQDCGPGYEAVGGACAQVGGVESKGPIKDELGYPKP